MDNPTANIHDPVLKRLPIKPRVYPNCVDSLNGIAHLLDLVEHLFAAFAFAHTGSRDEHSEHEPQRINGQKLLASFDELGSIKADLCADACGGFDAPAINDCF